MKEIHYVPGPHLAPGRNRFTVSAAEKARAFHRTVPGYAPTPLVRLKALAKEWGVGDLFVKDESFRFGLNAFKVLGGSYAIAWELSRRAGKDIGEISFSALDGHGATFVTATDGNHGRGVAWAARALGAKAVVYMPKGSSAERLAAIRVLGAEAEITDMNYDDAVRLAAKKAQENGWTVVQDTSWDGYEEIPARIMEGYTTMALEAAEELTAPPTHVFLQAGVGAMSGAVTGFLMDRYKNNPPRVIIVEPAAADCLYRTAKANDGRLHTVTGDLATIMAGLACGEPCALGWDILGSYADFFFSVPDEIAALGMRTLARPLTGDRTIISGESGAAPFGLLAYVMRERPDLAKMLGLDKHSRVLCISTEGDTDRGNYLRIVGGEKKG